MPKPSEESQFSNNLRYAGRIFHLLFQETLCPTCVIARTRRTNGANININKKLGFTIQPWPEELGPTSDEWVFMLLAREDWLLKNQPLVNQS